MSVLFVCEPASPQPIPPTTSLPGNYSPSLIPPGQVPDYRGQPDAPEPTGMIQTGSLQLAYSALPAPSLETTVRGFTHSPSALLLADRGVVCTPPRYSHFYVYMSYHRRSEQISVLIKQEGSGAWLGIQKGWSLKEEGVWREGGCGDSQGPSPRGHRREEG